MDQHELTYVRGPLPGLGEHTDSVLRELLGITATDICWLCAEEVIG